MVEVFVNDFRYWKEHHFNALSKKTIAEICDALRKKKLPLGMSTDDQRPSAALAEFVKKSRLTPKEERSHEEVNTVANANHSNKNLLGGSALRNNKNHSFAAVKEMSGKPSEVAKLYPTSMKYCGGPREPIRQRYISFKDACLMSKIDSNDTYLVLCITQSCFLEKSALKYFVEHVKAKATSPDDAIERLEKHFLGRRTRMVNDDVWDALTFDLVMQTRVFKKESTTNEDALNDLVDQVSDLSDIRSSPGSELVRAAKIIAAVKDCDIFKVVCQNPPCDLEELKAALRSTALEADRAAFKAASGSAETFRASASARKKATYRDSYFVDRRLHQPTNRSPIRGYGRGPGYNRKKKSVRFIPPDVCIVCDRKGCHSSKHRRKSSVLLTRAAKVFFANEESNECTNSEIGSDCVTSSSSEENEQVPDVNYTVSFHVSTVRSMMSLGVSKSNRALVVDGAILDTGSSTISTIGSDLVPAAVVASAFPTEPNYEIGKRKLNGVGNIVMSTIGYMEFHFFFGGLLYSCGVYIVPGSSPFLLSHKDLDQFGLNYQSLRKIIERRSDGYREDVEVRGNVPWLLFANPSYFTETQLRNMLRNLGHPTVEKHMRVTENAEYEDIPKETRAQLEKLVKYCKACQFN